METIIALVDDADHALRCMSAQVSETTQVRWVIVACAPRMTRRIGKWVSHSARENWRNKWAQRLYDQLLPRMHGDAQWITLIAKEPLPELLAKLNAEFGPVRVVDARRPKGALPLQVMAPEHPEVKARPLPPWQTPGLVLAFSLMLALGE